MQTQLKVIAFTDQVGSTSKTAQRTHAEIDRVNREQQSLTVEIVQQCRGAILKDTGDGHMIEFRACSDAVWFGFIIQQRVNARNDAQTNDNLKFDLHVGIDFGEVIVLENGDIRGSAANRAARVSGISPAGEVYFTDKVTRELNPREFSFEKVDDLPPLKGVEGEVTIYRLINLLGETRSATTTNRISASERAPNPFVWRDGITRTEDFFGRDREQRTLRDYLRMRQNCQIVGPRRIGKTSLLRQIERIAPEWNKAAVVAYVDLQDARCHTLTGWLKRISRQFAWLAIAQSMADFAECVEAMIANGVHPVLCLDEFEMIPARRAEFTGDVLIALRSCGQQGMSIITASKKPLNELTMRGDPTSPFYNIFPRLPLGSFSKEDASDFVTVYHSGVPQFTSEEKEAILDFAQGHPLALQVACFHALEAKEGGEKLTAAMQRAADDMKNHLPDGW